MLDRRLRRLYGVSSPVGGDDPHVDWPVRVGTVHRAGAVPWEACVVIDVASDEVLTWMSFGGFSLRRSPG